MIADRLAPYVARRGIHYGWVMVAVTFLTMLATAAAMGLPGVLLNPLRAEFGWDTSEVSGAMALRLVLFGAVGPFAAAMISRHGIRTSICSSTGLIAVGLALATRIDALWQLYFLWGVLVGVGTGMTAIVLGASVANHWFSQRRGLVLGLLTAAAASGQLLFLPLAAWLAETYGWRAAVLAPIAACVIAFFAMLLLGRNRPADLGLLPYGEVGAPAPATPGHAKPGPAALAGQSAIAASFAALALAARSPAFWVLIFAFAVCGFTTNGLVQTHFVPLCLDFGMTAVAASGVLALMAVFDFFGAIGSGWLTDRTDPRRLLCWYLGLRGVSLLLLPYTDFSIYGLSLFAVFYGLDWIATVPPTVALVGMMFGRERAGMVFGWVFTGHQLGAALGAMGAGFSRDALASYLPAFFVGGVLCLVAAAGALVIRVAVAGPGMSGAPAIGRS